jgi:hypothetical protein
MYLQNHLSDLKEQGVSTSHGRILFPLHAAMIKENRLYNLPKFPWKLVAVEDDFNCHLMYTVKIGGK